MIKKIICLGVVLVVVFSLSACSQGLTAYKEDAKQQIENYAYTKGQNNYSVESWDAILQAVSAGKTAIDDAASEPDVDISYLAAVQRIDAIIPKEEKMEEILKHFDLTDPKIFFDETSFSDNMYTEDDTIIVIFKKTTTYPMLDLHHFNLSNAKSFIYSQATPNDGPLGWVERDEGRQAGQIFLVEGGKEKIIEAIRHLEQLEFVKSAQPMHYVTTPC